MIVSFANQATEDVYNGKNSKAARRCCPSSIWRVAYRKLDRLDASTDIMDLQIPPGNRHEELSGDREDQHGIRINDPYRICFVWTEAGPEDVEIVDYH